MAQAITTTGVKTREQGVFILGKGAHKQAAERVVLGDQNKLWDQVITEKVRPIAPTILDPVIVPAVERARPWTARLISYENQSEVLVLGRTRSGKSVMINRMLSTNKVKEGDCMEPCTHDFQLIRSALAVDGRGIDFVDAEGRDEQNGEVFLSNLAGYLDIERRNPDSKLKAVAIVVRQKEQFGSGTCYDQIRACVEGFWGVVVVVTASTRQPGIVYERADPVYDNWLQRLQGFFHDPDPDRIVPVVRVCFVSDDHTPNILGHNELAAALIAAVDRGRELEGVRREQVREVLSAEAAYFLVRDYCITQGEVVSRRLSRKVREHSIWQRALDQEDARREWVGFIDYTLQAFLVQGLAAQIDGISCAEWLFREVRRLFDRVVDYADLSVWLMAIIPVVGWERATTSAGTNTEKLMRSFSVQWTELLCHLRVMKVENEGVRAPLRAPEVCDFIRRLGH